jgi:hypothetical protein
MIRKQKASEAQVHSAVVEHLRLRAKPGVLFLHPANGEHRDKITGAKLKRMGVLAGASDLLLWHNGNSFALELKAPGGRPSEAQLEFMARFNAAGGYSASAEGLDRALEVLERWQILRGRAVTPPRRCPTSTTAAHASALSSRADARASKRSTVKNTASACTRPHPRRRMRCSPPRTGGLRDECARGRH